MRKIPGIQIAREEWLGLAGSTALALLIYALLIHPSTGALSDLNRARIERDAAVSDLTDARQRHQALLAGIADHKHQLESLGGTPPSLRDKEAQVARVINIADGTRVTIDQYSPIGEIDTPDYSAAFVQFVGRGPFPAVREFFRRAASELDYIDFTHFTITSMPNPATPEEPTCLVAWSCKLSGMPRLPADAAPDRGKPAPRTEVALHEP